MTTYPVNKISEMTIEQFTKNHLRAFVTINDNYRITANLILNNGKFFLMVGPNVVQNSMIENVNKNDFENLAKLSIETYLK